MPKPYPHEFRDVVVRVARGRAPDQSVRQIAADFGVSESCLTGWMKAEGTPLIGPVVMRVGVGCSSAR